jgi:hypothetical protein
MIAASGNLPVDRWVGRELLKAIAPLGVEASFRALEELSTGDATHRAALPNKLEQLVYAANNLGLLAMR